MNSIVKTAKLTILACGTLFAAQRKGYQGEPLIRDPAFHPPWRRG
jgi:hypothetical protein